MRKENRIVGLIGFFSVIIGFLSKAIYRDFININEINDFGIAEFLPSYFYVLGFSLLLLMRPTNYAKAFILIVTLASILFELKQWTSTGKFDAKDIFASIAGGITAILILNLVRKLTDKKKQST
jgi:hypothetical protein